MGERKKSRRITEEDIAEYIAKKAQKQALKVAKKLKSENVSGYANDSNPFGDSNLSERFVWRKKIERDVARGGSLDSFSLKAEKKRQRERMAEIEKGKKRRKMRAMEKAQHEEEIAFLARERARAEFQDWEKKEDEFLFDQSKIRSEIRWHEGRVRPIDILIKQQDPDTLDDLDMGIGEPYMVFRGLTVKELEELEDDIKLHLGLDRATPVHTQYWEALLVICGWELAGARKRDALDLARVRGKEVSSLLCGEEKGIHSSIEADVMNFLQGKTYAELEAQQSWIESRMRSGEDKLVEFWESLLTRLPVFKAKAFLKEIHAQVLRKHLQCLEETLDSTKPDDHDKNDAQVVSLESTPQTEVEAADDQEAGSYSPQLLYGDDNEAAIDPEVDRSILERKRVAVLEEQRLQQMISRPTLPEDNFEKKDLKAMGAMEGGDAVFGSNDEINLDSQGCWWHDKFRPRKPKYFNRVHSGYEWNKYNQTHYDHDNPPPKIVQGYKFNIFYPDLIDRSRTPTYTIEKDGESEETCIIKFHGGPPYQDIAFRIVNNKEWEYSQKKGFKCTFERGIFHLYFNFKRYCYRR